MPHQSSDAVAESTPTLHVLTRRSELPGPLASLLRSRGFALETFADPDRLIDRLGAGSRGPVLIDTEALRDPEGPGPLMSAIETRTGRSVPWVCLGPGTDIQCRLAALRAGACAYLDLPIRIEDLVERVLDLTDVEGKPADRVLVVDDQPVAVLFATRCLQAAGMVTESVGDPLKVLEAMESFVPDLILMDLHMPGASGIELTGIIRGQDRFADVPILFLSAELDTDQQLAALRVGGDDFLVKPVAPDRLVASVRQRLRRARETARRRRALDTVDPSTGLVSPGRLLSRLDQLIGRGGPEIERRALVVLELVGDEQALLRLARTLSRSTALFGPVARVGEHRLATLVRGDTPDALSETCGKLSDALAEHGLGGALGIGWCRLAESGGDSVTLLSRAGQAAGFGREATERAARGSGGDGAVAACVTASSDRSRDPDEVRAAVRAERLRVLFEPIVSLAPPPVARYELSPRLEIRGGELLSPADFLSAARDGGLTEQLDRWVLGAGLDVLTARQAAGRPVQLLIGQSIESIRREDWIGFVRDEINRRELFRLRPVLQFRVSEVVAELDLFAERVDRLVRLGIRLSLGGFDAADRSEGVLGRIPASFVRLADDVARSLEPPAIAALIRRARSTGTLVIADGVDSPETIALYCRAGADLLQGPFVQPPSVAMDYDFIGMEAGAGS